MTHIEIGQFISAPVSQTLTLQIAQRLAAHLAQCDPCALELQAHEAHRDALLGLLAAEADRLIPDEYQPAHAEFEASQRELRMISRTVLEAMPEAAKTLLEELGEPSPEQRAELRTLSDLRPAAFRAALAVAEASLTLESLVLRSQRGKVALYADGTVVRDRESIPSSYFAGRLAERSRTPTDVAAALWSVVAEKTVAGGVGLPGLATPVRIRDLPEGVELQVV